MITHESEENGKRCEINKELWYIIFSCTASFFAPCVIMITVYVRIYYVGIKRTREPPGERQREYGNAGNQERKATEGEVNGGNDKEINVLDVEEEPSSSDDNILCSLVKKRGARATKVAQVKPGETSPTPEAQPCVRVSKWKARQHRERRFTFVLAVVMGVFVLCWFPFFFTYTLMALCTCQVPDILFTMFFWFGYCNSSLNPVIYTIFNNDFRRSFKKILCKWGRRGL
ncbi:Alpha-2A adrenergic receptor [Nibea albiflora]|uniref:Alpha-2A adrenergic receptor n=1 Tax=Nibea albiflora TaxID=240163 RepID=A0ACB7EEE1_NIBAL|nr:Alpha-2A adrenergic receptor [Nibea albiflora]